MILFATALALSDPLPERVYNRPGATAAAIQAEQRRCRAITLQTTGTTVLRRPLAPPVGNGSVPSGPDGSVTGTIEDCMVARGWNVIALSAGDRRRLDRMAPAARTRALAALSAASRPAYGRIVRRGAGLLALPRSR